MWRVFNGHATALDHIRSGWMRRIAQQRATFLAPFLQGLPIVYASFDDGCWVGRANHAGNRLMPVPKPA